jgi:hypothetical protein
MNLPRTGPSDIMVYLPDNLTLKATGTTQLPLQQLSTKAKKANILPGLTKSLIRVNKMAESGYITIFRPGDKGVTFHKEGTLTITTSEPPVLQGCRGKERHYAQYQYHKQPGRNKKKSQMYTTYLPLHKRSNTSTPQQATQPRTPG